MERITINGATSYKGERVYDIRQGRARAAVPQVDFLETGAAPFKTMARAGIVVIGRKAQEAFREELGQVDDYPQGAFVNSIGWNGRISRYPPARWSRRLASRPPS